MQLGGLGRFDAGQLGARVAEAGQERLRFGDVALGGAGQRRRLEERQQLDEIVGAERPVGGRQRPVLADELGGGGEELHAVEPQAGVGGGRDGVAETDERGRPGVVEHDVAHPRVAVGDAPVVQSPQVRPRVVEDGIGDALRLHLARVARPAGCARRGWRRRATPPGRRRPASGTRAPVRPARSST